MTCAPTALAGLKFLSRQGSIGENSTSIDENHENIDENSRKHQRKFTKTSTHIHENIDSESMATITCCHDPGAELNFIPKKNLDEILSNIFGTKIWSEILNEKTQSKNQSKNCPKFLVANC